MAQLLEPGAQKVIGSKKVVSQQDNLYTYEITVNAALQKEVYERLFTAKSKEVEIKGFRKGEAPRNIVEQQIYQDIVKDLVNLIVNYSVEELLSDEEIIAITSPEVEKVNFTVVESALTFTVKIDRLPDYKMPEIAKFVVQPPKAEVTTEDVAQAKTNLWAEWEKKASDADKAEFKELSDIWVEKKMNIPNVKTIAQLEVLLKEELEHAKLHQEEDKLVNEALAKVVESMKISVPQSYVEKSVEANKKSQEEQFQKYGITFEEYLKHYNKTAEEYAKEVETQATKRFREDVFWTLYIKNKGIKINPQDSKDVVFINYAASAMQVKADEKLSQRQVDMILQTAAMYKAVQQFREEVGLKPHEEPEMHISDEKTPTEEK